MSALVASYAEARARVLIVGAGGGREIEKLLQNNIAVEITAVDPSARNLETARLAAEACPSKSNVTFIAGKAEDLPRGSSFDVATSLLVMHHISDDGAKLAYLRSIRDRLVPGGLLIHADVCVARVEDFDHLIPAYRKYAQHVGTCPDATRLELEAIAQLPVASDERTRALFSEAGLIEPQEVFRTLWYRCWISKRNPP
ncbi:class I SAM-dependent methyltransferase [Jannaschia sp. CCS1]|uniref:class I SAM-dependent methyltransferase n=1 Tax=Jannaschia sp. (strain CCS1) TaxID=290400 RepID=UPI0020C78D62|nr:class I SAM-dependent methyltransferase [Jannaschia sp. CCS1]